MPDVRFGVLGPVMAWRGEEVVTPTSATQRALLGVLLLAESRPLSAERLLTLLRPEETVAGGRAWVQVAISRLRSWLRKTAGPIITLRHRTDGYLLEVPQERLDLGQFRVLHSQAQRAEPMDQLALWDQALRLWRGPVLGDIAASLPEDTVIVQVERLRVDAVLGLAEAALTVGEPLRALPHVTDLAALHPLDERVHAVWALLLAASGRQAEALQLVEETRDRLAEELGIDPGEHLRSAHLRVLRQQALPAGVTPRTAAPAAAARWRGQRPDLKTLIGRDQERNALVGHLSEHRVTTIVGPGGCGKTALALHVAEKVEPDFAAGVVVVGLASLTGEDDVVMELASLLDVSAPTVDQARLALAHALEGQHLLIVLDNCEHLTATCARVVRFLVDRAPRVAVLATSRQPIGVVEERVWPLGTLEVPGENSRVDRTNPAVALFLRRATEALPTLRVSDEDVELAGAVCRRLDGLPLAIELAAARVRALSISQLARRLEAGLSLLSAVVPTAEPGRRALHETIDWSYRLLTQPERLLFARLSVFRSSFTIEAAEAACGGEPLSRGDVLSLLIALVDRSLVRSSDVAGERRYQMLSTVREFARGRLPDADDTDDRHLDYWLAVAREVDALPDYPDRAAYFRRMAADGPNIQAALDYGFAGARAADATELVARLSDFWLMDRAYLGRVEDRLRQAAERSDACSPEVRCLIRYWSAFLFSVREEYAEARHRMAAVLPEVAKHRPREYQEGVISLVTSGRFVLDPAVLDEVPTMLAAMSEQLEGDAPSTALTAAAGVYATWGRYGEALELCERYAARAARRGTPFSISQQVVRTELAVGMGSRDEADVWFELLSEQLGAMVSPLEQEPARRAMALVLLASRKDEQAREFLRESVAELERSYAPSLARSAYLRVLLAEARRRAGELDDARYTLLAGLSGAMRRTHLRVGFTGVLVAALIAVELGDQHAGQELAERWDRLRRLIGLPIPAGFVDAAAVLGLEAGDSGQPNPTWVWRLEELQDLIERAQRWCSRGLRHIPLAAHGGA